jgi:ankyrin repeat protein
MKRSVFVFVSLISLTATVCKPMNARRRLLVFWEMPPLHKVAHDGTIEQVRTLGAAGAVDELDEMGCTPLHYAIRRGDLDIIRELVTQGADAHKPQNNGVSVDDLVRGANPDVRRWYFEVEPRIQLFLQKLQDGDLSQVQMALAWKTHDGQHGVDLRVTRPGFLYPLHYAVIHAGSNNSACTNPWIRVVQTMIVRCAPVNMRDLYGNTPLHYAVQNRNHTLARYLIAHQATPSIGNNNGMIPVVHEYEFLARHVFGEIQ